MAIYKKTYAFIDTSILDPMHNDYGRIDVTFENLKKHISNNKLVLFTHEIVIKEIENHIKLELRKKLEEYDKIQKSKELILLTKSKKYKRIFHDIDIAKAITETIKCFKEKISDTGFLVIKTGNISIKNIVNNYFLCKPPFSERKKSEFPDALMLESIKSSFRDIDNIHIVSADSDWEKVSIDNKFSYHKNLNSLLDYLNRQNQIAETIQKFIDSKSTKSNINSRVLEIIRNMNFRICGQEIDRKGIVSGFDYEYNELMNVNITGIRTSYIEDIEYKDNDKDKGLHSTVIIKCNVNLTFDCIYNDIDNLMWDSEEKEYISFYEEVITEIHKITLPIRIDIIGDKDSNLVISNISSVYGDETIELNSVTLIKQFSSENCDDTFHCERQFECPSCNSRLFVDLISDGTECVYSNEREMGAENQYEIDVYGECPICKSKYHITGELWEYPKGTYATDNNLKITKENN